MTSCYPVFSACTRLCSVCEKKVQRPIYVYHWVHKRQCCSNCQMVNLNANGGWCVADALAAHPWFTWASHAGLMHSCLATCRPSKPFAAFTKLCSGYHKYQCDSSNQSSVYKGSIYCVGLLYVCGFTFYYISSSCQQVEPVVYVRQVIIKTISPKYIKTWNINFFHHQLPTKH